MKLVEMPTLGSCLSFQHSSPRLKEWLPLFSQQMRLRNLLQIVAYNVTLEVDSREALVQSDEKNVENKNKKIRRRQKTYYYTLHLTTMSAPFYTSEKVDGENPKWAEIEICDIIGHVNASVSGVVIRLWHHSAPDRDQVITVWGVYFSGLVYLGPKLITDPALFCINTIVLRMHGGFFTAPQCFREAVDNSRSLYVLMNPSEVRPSYNVNLLLRLQTIQQAIKAQTLSAKNLHDIISSGEYGHSIGRESAALRRLLHGNKAKQLRRQEALQLKKQLELHRFRVTLLRQEKTRYSEKLEDLEKLKKHMEDHRKFSENELIEQYEVLKKENDSLKEYRKQFIDTRERFLRTAAQLNFRRKQLITELNTIYPVKKEADGKYSICGHHLPNSEDFAGSDEMTLSVALGYVAHVVLMISIFLQVPLRYPVVHYGSRSRIIDHISEKIPDKDREFPLYLRGRDKLQFNYGVYLLNKNIAQLRWYCGLVTQDLRATLPNLLSLLHLQPNSDGKLESSQSVSGSSVDLRSSPQSSSRRGHRVSKSMGSNELQFAMTAVSTKHPENPSVLTIKPTTEASTLSYSLDKGLNEYNANRKIDTLVKPSSQISAKNVTSYSLLGSEPNLSLNKISGHIENEVISSGDEARCSFLRGWQATGPVPICSDDDIEILHQVKELTSNLQQNINSVNNGSDKVLLSTAFISDTVNKKSESEGTVNIMYDPNSVEKLSILEKIEKIKLDQKPLTESHEKKHNSEEIGCSQIEPDVHSNSAAQFPAKIINTEHPTCYNRSKDVDILENGDKIFSGVDYVEDEDDDPTFVLKKLNCPKNAQKETKRVIDRGKTSEQKDESPVAQNSNLSDFIDSSMLVFASVASRTEALANQAGSFNLVRSRHSSMVEDGPS